MTVLAINSDTRLRQSVQQELHWDSRVDDSEVGVAVHEGVVTLTGTVDSYAAKQAAAEAAHRVEDVLDVANDLMVKAPGTSAHSDTDIAQAVRRTLEWDTLVPHEHIQSTVSNGWVMLTGMVSHRSQSEDAERAVRYLRGVSGVTNRIVISAPPVAPGVVQAAIEQALERRAARKAQRIGVEVTADTVRLTGRVRSWWEKQAVIGAAGHAPGIHAVRDELIIDPLA